MQNILDWLKKHKSGLKSNIVGLLLSFSILFIAGKIVESLFIQGQFLNLFGLSSLSVQMNFCLHITMILFSVSGILFGFVVDLAILRKEFPRSARLLFWMFLLVAILVKVIGHYNSLNSIGAMDVNLFREIRFLICY